MEPTLRRCPWGVRGLRVQAAGVLGRLGGSVMPALPPACCVTPRAPFRAPDNSLPFPSFSASVFNSSDLLSLAHRVPGPEEAE